MNQFVDYYKLIGANRNDSEENIKASYRNLVKKYHDDGNHGATLEEQELLRQLLEAQQIFKNPQSKEKYDREYDEYYAKVKDMENNNQAQVHAKHHFNAKEAFRTIYNDFYNLEQTNNNQKQTNNNQEQKHSDIDVEASKLNIKLLGRDREALETKRAKLDKSLKNAKEIYKISDEQETKNHDKKLENTKVEYFNSYYDDLIDQQKKLLEKSKKVSIFSNQKKNNDDLNAINEKIEDIKTQAQGAVNKSNEYFQMAMNDRQEQLQNMQNEIKNVDKKIDEINKQIKAIEDALAADINLDNVDESDKHL